MDSDLIRAAKVGDLEEVKRLAFQEEEALTQAVKNGHLNVVKSLEGLTIVGEH